MLMLMLMLVWVGYLRSPYGPFHKRPFMTPLYWRRAAQGPLRAQCKF